MQHSLRVSFLRAHAEVKGSGPRTNRGQHGRTFLLASQAQWDSLEARVRGPSGFCGKYTCHSRHTKSRFVGGLTIHTANDTSRTPVSLTSEICGKVGRIPFTVWRAIAYLFQLCEGVLYTGLRHLLEWLLNYIGPTTGIQLNKKRHKSNTKQTPTRREVGGQRTRPRKNFTTTTLTS